MAECRADTDNAQWDQNAHIVALFAVVGASAVGVFLPIIGQTIRGLHQMSVPGFPVQMGQFFGAGVIVATAFLHLLPAANDVLTSSCLDRFSDKYGAWACLFALAAVFTMHSVEWWLVEAWIGCTDKSINFNVALGGIGTDVVTSCVREEPIAHKLICLEGGRSIAVPVDKHVLTDDGWIPVAELRAGDKVTCGSTYGVESNLIDPVRVYESDGIRLSATATLEARQAMAFARILGLQNSDGYSSKAETLVQMFTGSLFDVRALRSDIGLLGYEMPDSCISGKPGGLGVCHAQLLPYELAAAINGLEGQSRGRRSTQETEYVANVKY
ncbi:hypothetical protein GGH96_000722 [Coemansia sp. RSA 1972]|nr:hypothetical protein GGH96_000722 [Coemansia sp. RSA 1972]